MRLVVHIDVEERPTPFVPEFAALNVWGEMVLATIYVWEAEVSEGEDGGWDLSFECVEIVSFPYAVVTEDNIADRMAGHDTELALAGIVSAQDDYDWDEASDGASAAFLRDGEEPLECTTCRILMRRRGKARR